MNFFISEELQQLYTSTALGVLYYRANVQKSTPALLELLDKTISELRERCTLEDIAHIAQIAATRNAYKALGKSPYEYRNAAEAMLRRIVKGNGLYHISNIVEVNNLVSITSGYSIGSYDVSNLSGNITLHRAPDGASYEGIGKGAVNIEHLPTLYDDIGAFGNPSSDSRRAMTQPGDHEIISVLYAFDGGNGLEKWMMQFKDLLQTYCDVQSVEASIFRGSDKIAVFVK
ncbi:B3/B4 domain-containing protein [Pelosinus propionicus]|uniref:B3/B4 domain-containing protein (DNA/RNA-binding domain of Phe-tRNA-synthetase) n=1 Tax=Pelosinus propionicus DSM 13327 TaxID=1123291 RepID=A0A1I4PHC0_9FIRM|nr:phenylalanine--tRNA ligase beta subunit-related protein [Pelosinus propionicus]SFM27201.1 B3/B4 domain-containing protein (DNA/RNA-binding domain of Phe-tRNA-synthetase) [Pelosinus propionicus DSM 13327]